MMMKAWAFRAVGALLLVGCGSSGAGEPESGETAEEQATGPAGVHVSEDGVVFRTEEFSLGPGEEKFLCYAKTLEEDLVVDRYVHAGAPHLHHVIFSRAGEPEPEGFSECDILFRSTWEPLYLTGTGSSSLEFPEGVGHSLPEGTQLVAQLHLLNATDEPVTDVLEIEMRRSPAENPRPMGNYIFGSLGLRLPPLQASTVEGICNVDEEVEIVAAFPHMHWLGQALTFEAGPSEDAMETIFERDPYDFDNQEVEPFPLTLSPGDVTRVTCHYENTYDHEVTFGESTTNEMCFFVGFAVGFEGINACLGGSADVGDPVPIDPAAGQCGDHEPSADGVGLPCTSGGGECPADMMCTADYREQDAEGVCFSTGCETAADCGGGDMTCCTPPQAGGVINLCIPEACRLEECVPTD